MNIFTLGLNYRLTSTHIIFSLVNNDKFVTQSTFFYFIQTKKTSFSNILIIFQITKMDNKLDVSVLLPYTFIMASIEPVRLAFDVFEPACGIENENPIIFLHGLTASKEYWYDLPQVVADTTRRKAYALDSRNHGDSEWSDEFSLDTNVVDLLYFLNQIEAKKAILVGHSMGGLTSIHAALKAPTKIEKIAVEDMIVGEHPQKAIEDVKSFLSELQATVSEIPKNTTMENALRILSNFEFNCLTEKLKLLSKRQKSKTIFRLKQNPDGSYNLKANMKVLENTLRSLFNAPTGIFNGPSVFIYGKESYISVCEDEETIKKHFPNAQFIGIDDAGHEIHLDNPQAFKEALLEFLQK